MISGRFSYAYYKKVINLKGEKEMIDFEVRENDVMLKAKDNVIKKSDPFGSLFCCFLAERN